MPDDITEVQSLIADLTELQRNRPELKAGYQEFQRNFRVYEELARQFDQGTPATDVSAGLLHRPV